MKIKKNLVLTLLLVLCFSLVLTACKTTKYELSLTATVGGSVNGAGKFEEGESVTITATENLGYNFTGWYRDGEEWATNATHTFTMPAEKLSLEAKFAKNSHEVTVTKEGNGTVTGEKTYEYGATVTLTATADTGYTFAGWYNPSTASTPTETTATYTFTMPDNAVAIKAVFTINSHAVTVTKEGNGTITGENTYAVGTTVTLTATADIGYSFAGWYNPATASTPTETNATYTFTMQDNAVEVKAVFTINSHAVTVTKEGNGTITGENTYEYGATVTLVAAAAEGYSFAGWHNPADATAPIETSKTYTFTMQDSAITVKAVFTLNGYGVVVDIVQNGSATGASVTGDGYHYYDETVTLTAIEGENQKFIGWYNINLEEIVETELIYEFTMPNEDVSLEAWFVTAYSVTITVTGGGSIVGGGIFEPGQTVEVEAFSSSVSTFIGWYENDELIPGANTYYIFEMPSRNVSLECRFMDTFESGEGTEEDPFIIMTAAQLQILSMLVNGSNNYSEGKYFELGANINLNGAEWTPIGYLTGSMADKTRAFSGHFNGKNFIVSNFKITKYPHEATYNDYLFAGLFGVTFGGSIRNLNITDCVITVTYAKQIYAGGLTGFNSSCNITSCSVSAQISIVVAGAGAAHEVYGGGLVGSLSSGLVTSCITSGSVYVCSGAATDTTSYAATTISAGGLVGYCLDKITLSHSSALVEAKAIRISAAEGSVYAGGLVGFLNADLTGCYATGNVIGNSGHTQSWVGGLIGAAAGGAVSNNYATGNVTAISTPAVASSSNCHAYAGGFIGGVGRYSGGSAVPGTATVSLCYATGSVNALAIHFATPTLINGRNAFAGGFAGLNCRPVTNCYALGNVKAETQGTAATAMGYAGGFVGRNENANGLITNCYAKGNVEAISASTSASASVHAGGFAGIIAAGKMTSCVAIGNVSAKAVNAVNLGGFVGNNTGTHEKYYRYENQTFTKTIGETPETNESTNILGDICTKINLNTSTFYTGTLGWSEEIWDLTNLNFDQNNLPVFLIEE